MDLISAIALAELVAIGWLLWRLRCQRRERHGQRQTEVALFAAQNDAVLGRMAGRVAHEVNNPLEAIKIYIEPLRKRVQDRPEVDHGLEVIDQQVDRIARLVRGLLSFVRQRTLHRSSAQAGEVIQTVADLLQPRFAKAHKRLDVIVPVLPCAGGIDVDGVQQVLINLLENALVAVPAGGWVRLEASCTGDGWLRIEVSDNGPGLGDDPEALFQPFVTTKAEGSGLGLTVARQICEAHGGWLKGTNRPGGGAVFDVALRMARAVAAAGPEAA